MGASTLHHAVLETCCASLQKASFSCFRQSFQGLGKYVAGGATGHDGCIYFAPYNAGKVLFINAEGGVELLEPELPEGEKKYFAGGATGNDGCIYFAPCDAGKV